MPVRMETANLDFATGPDKDQPYLDRLSGQLTRRIRQWLRGRTNRAPMPRVLFLQEAKTGRVLRMLGALVNGLQGVGEAKSGTALVAYGVRLTDKRLWLAGDSSETLPRFVTEGVLTIDGSELLCLSAHVFPKRAGKTAQARYVEQLRLRVQAAEDNGQAWVLGTDANMELWRLATTLGGVAWHRGITGFVTSPNVVVTGHGTDRWGMHHHVTDHPSHHIIVAGVLS